MVASSTGVPTSARTNLGFFNTTDVGEKLGAQQLWWTDGSNSEPQTVEALEEVCLWFGKDDENRYNQIRHEMHTQNLPLFQAPKQPKRNIGNCVAAIRYCLTMKPPKISWVCFAFHDASWHIMTSLIFLHFCITVLKLLKYLDHPFCPREPKIRRALLLRSSTFPGFPAQGITQAEGLSTYLQSRSKCSFSDWSIDHLTNQHEICVIFHVFLSSFTSSSPGHRCAKCCSPQWPCSSLNCLCSHFLQHLWRRLCVLLHPL